MDHLICFSSSSNVHQVPYASLTPVKMSCDPPPIPTSAEGFTSDWALAVMRKWFEKNDKCIDNVKIIRVEPKVNPEQVNSNETKCIN